MRYIAIILDRPSAPEAQVITLLRDRVRQLSKTWLSVEVSAKILIFYEPPPRAMENVYIAGSVVSVIFGRLFGAPTSPLDDSVRVVERLSREDYTLLVRNGPSHLLDNYWGWYIAFYALPDGGWILRSPMSDFGCLMTEVRGLRVFASSAEDIQAIHDAPLTIDWGVVQLQVGLGSSVMRGLSGIREISIVERGEIIYLRRGGIERKQLWDPRRFVSNPIDDVNEATSLFRARVRSAVRSWGSVQSGVIVRLSGGFDSSLVLSCLARTPRVCPIVALNYFWDHASSDERRYARAMASHADIALIERRLGTDNCLNKIHKVQRTVCPVIDVAEWQEHGRDAELARSLGFSAIFMGAMGDGLFQQQAFPDAILEYCKRRPFGPRIPAIAFDLGLATGESIWRILWKAFKPGRPVHGPWSIEAALMQQGVLTQQRILVPDRDVESFLHNLYSRVHPWFQNVGDLSVGKRFQMATLYMETYEDTPFQTSNSPRTVGPFLSQPLVELCLRIPSYMNLARGEDRAVARSAFAEDLPSIIRHRCGKGTASRWLDTILIQELAFVRSFLMDGILIQRGVIDPEKCRLYLPDNVTKSASHAGSILKLLYVEAWARAWSSNIVQCGRNT